MERFGVVDRLHRQRTLVDGDHVMGSSGPESEPSALVGDEIHACAVMKTVDVVAARPHVQPGQQRVRGIALSHAHELLADDVRLHVALPRDGCVLPVAATASTGYRVCTSGGHTVRRNFEHLLRLSTQETAAVADFGDLSSHQFARDTETDEDHLAVVPSDAVAAMCGTIEVDVDDVADGKGHVSDRRCG